MEFVLHIGIQGINSFVKCQTDATERTVVANRREAQLRCLGLAHSIDRFEVRNITSEYHCRPFPTTKVETFNQCSGVVWTKRIRYECN
jgi:hypothetical protein